MTATLGLVDDDDDDDDDDNNDEGTEGAKEEVEEDEDAAVGSLPIAAGYVCPLLFGSGASLPRFFRAGSPSSAVGSATGAAQLFVLSSALCQ